MNDNGSENIGTQVWFETQIDEIIYEAFNTQIPWILDKYKDEITKYKSVHAFDAMKYHFPMIEKLICGILLKTKDDIRTLTENLQEGA